MDLEAPFRTLLSTLGLELYDVEFTSGTLNVTVTKPGGIDLDELTAASRSLSAWLDEKDPMPGRYTLDVASPGLERRLRTPEHFRFAIGDLVTLRERRGSEATRRLEGILQMAEGRKVTLDDKEIGEVTVDLDNVERARTVFVWGSGPKPSPSKATPTSSTASRRK